MIRFELRRSREFAQPYYWRIVATSNGAVLAHSENYVRRDNAINAVNLVKQYAAAADFIDYTKAA